MQGESFGCGGEVWGVEKVWGVEQKILVQERSLECGGQSEVQEVIVGYRGKLQGARKEYRVQGESLGLRGGGGERLLRWLESSRRGGARGLPLKPRKH